MYFKYRNGVDALKERTPDMDVLCCNVYKCIKLQSENRGLTEAGNYCTQYKNHTWTATPDFVLYCVEQEKAHWK